ncbi:MAG: hypothetical protein FJ304_16585 [Planctomycetes bacterium]|nr:hypothetical protein [Planctomycetota bacterium]
MRKLLMALCAMFFMAGLVVAVEVTVVKYDKDKKEVTVKEGDKENTYKVGDKTKFTTTAKGENSKESTYEAFEKRVSGKKGGAKLDIKFDKDTLTDVSWKTKGK